MNSCAAAPNRRNDHLSPGCSERLPSGKCCSRKRQRSWFSMQQLNAPRPNTSKWQSSHIEEPRLYPTTGPLGALYHRPDARIKLRPTPHKGFATLRQLSRKRYAGPPHCGRLSSARIAFPPQAIIAAFVGQVSRATNSPEMPFFWIGLSFSRTEGPNLLLRNKNFHRPLWFSRFLHGRCGFPTF
jgi:hypothetical protein